MEHTAKELIQSVVDSESEYHEIFDEILQIWEGRKLFKDASWKARMVFARWIAGKEMEQSYNSTFQK